MRRLILAIAALAGVFLQAGAAVATPVLHLSGWKASAGNPESFTITRIGGNGAATVMFRTSDGSAAAGPDYAATSLTIDWARGQTSATIKVATFVNPAKAGQNISFTAAITGPAGTSSATGLIVEPALAPPPTPTPTPTPSPLGGEATIADNFDISAGLDLTWTNPRGGIAPPSSDPVGSFRMFCTAGQVLRDDPIVYPGQPGASHLHQFFGNTGANAFSTYQSLRTTGGTTCGQLSAPINRSAYWIPAMLNGKGMVVKPDFLNVYYKRDPLSDPMCNDPTATTGVGQCVDLPNGLRFVFGHNMKTMTGGPADLNSIDSQSITIQCWAKWDGSVSNGGASGYYHTFDEARAAGCVQPGAQLLIIAAAPNCWDGKNLDSADHRSHIANSTGPMLPTQMFRACTPDHPYVLPNLEVQIHYTIDQDFADGLWALDSDIQEGQMLGHKVAGGTTWHMDYWEAWSPAGKGRWHANCIDKHLTCSEGDLGDGYQIVGSGTPNGWWTTHQTVPLSSIP